MVRNDYRRALILLRSNAPDYSGHVRLERRTLIGSMYFVLRTPEDAGTLDAVLVGRSKDAYYACPLGTFRKDMRGQSTLGWNFNPRDVCGRDLEQYQKIVVARRSGEECQIVLFGNINGFAEMNWEGVRSAVCLSLQEGVARAAVGEFTEPPGEMESAQHIHEEAPQAEAWADAGELHGEDTPDTEYEPPAEAAAEAVLFEEAEDQAECSCTAAEALGVSTDLPWPESIESLRPIFRTQSPLENAPDANYTYIAAPMPAGSGYSECAVGLRAENGMPNAVCYALRSAYTVQPPAGMEDYTWSGNGNEGWWKLELNIADGMRIPSA